jgi:hypothetical protein
MVPPHPFRPRLEELGARTLPSATPLAPVVLPSAPAAVPAPTHPLHGTGSGTFTGSRFIVDAGPSDTLAGTVTLTGLGQFRVAGWVQGVGLIAQGRAAGQLTLSSARGTVTLALHGPVQGAFGALPAEWVYAVQGGTGAYRALTGYGVVQVTLTPAPVAAGLPPAGRFTLAFV